MMNVILIFIIMIISLFILVFWKALLQPRTNLHNFCYHLIPWTKLEDRSDDLWSFQLGVLPSVTDDCYCRVLLPTVTADCVLPTVTADCYCRLLLHPV